MHTLKVINNENSDMCGPCGGKCCQYHPGIYHPMDFSDENGNLDEDKIFEALKNNNVVIDWWEGDPHWKSPDKFQDRNKSYYLRAPTDRDHNDTFNAIYGGKCRNLTPEGCSLTFDNRPIQCRALTPGADQNCIIDTAFEKAALAIAWYDFHDTIEALGELAEEEKEVI